jgi:hypothetical protein
MSTCERLLYEFLGTKVEPTATQQKSAARSQNLLRDLLCAGPFGNRIVDTYLSGSYARATAVRPLDDVDIVVVVDPRAWEMGWLSTTPAPEKVLTSFANAIRRRYPDSGVHLQNRSVGLKLYHLDIDVIPAIDVGGNLIKIPDRFKGDWIKSAPKRHSELATNLNDIRSGKFKPLVKLLKTWNNNLPSTAHVKSFLIETMAVRIFSHIGFDSLEDGLLRFFDFLTTFTNESSIFKWQDKFGMSFDWMFGICVPDTAATGSNVAARVDWTRAQKLLNYATYARNKMEDADAAAYEDTAYRRVCEALRI